MPATGGDSGEDVVPTLPFPGRVANGRVGEQLKHGCPSSPSLTDLHFGGENPQFLHQLGLASVVDYQQPVVTQTPRMPQIAPGAGR